MKRKPVSPKAAPIRKRTVVLVDDHPVVREGLAQRIGLEPDFQVCATAATAALALLAVEKHRPDMAVVDLSLPDGHGLEVIKQIHARCPAVRVFVFSMHDETIYGERALCAGAHGYMMKHEAPERVIAAMRRVLAGEVGISPRLSDKLVKAAVGSGGRVAGTDAARLSDRELEIFQLIGEGVATKEIAARLHRSVKTIETHRLRIKRKLGISTAAELIATAASRAAVSQGPKGKRPRKSRS